MHRLRVLALLLATCSGGAVAASDAAAPESARAQLAILETTDIHSHVLGYDYDKLAIDPHVGLDRVATLIGAARKRYPNTLLFDNGDTIQGTALADWQALASPVACDIELAVYRAMDLLHYDAGTIGNHEFNYGLPFLSRVTGTPMPFVASTQNYPRPRPSPASRREQKSCAGPHYPLVLSNMVRASDGAPVFQPWLLLMQEIVVTDPSGKTQRTPIRIGVLGFTPPPVMQWDHAHLHGKVRALGVIEAASKYLPELQAQHPDIVIALIHGGLDVSPYTPQMENAGWHLAGMPGIDVLLLGHSHDVFPNPADPASRFANLREVDNARGFVRGKPAVMGGFYGKDLGVIALALIRRDGHWSIDAARSRSRVIPICADQDRCIAPDPRIARAVRAEHAATSEYVRTPIGASDFRISTYFTDVGDVSALAVVNAAQRAYAMAHLYDAHPQLRDLPLLSAASAFKTGFAGPQDYSDVAPGPLSIRSAADLYPYPNTLTVVKLDGAGVRAWLEHSAEYFNRIDPSSNAPQELINRKFPSFNFDVLQGAPDDGFSYAIDVSKAAGQRIVELRLRGKPVDPKQTFLIVTNNYRAEGGGHFPGLDGSATVWSAPDANRDAVIDYVRDAKTLHRAVFAQRPWRFATLHTRAPVTFACVAGKLDIARADGVDNVSLLRGNRAARPDQARGGLCAIDLLRQGLLTPAQMAAPSALCPQGKASRERCMSIHRRATTPPCGQRATPRRVAPPRPPHGIARLGHRVAMAPRCAPCLAAAARATRLTWHGVNRP